VAAVQQANESLVVPRDLPLKHLSPEEFKSHILQLAASNYPTYGILGQLVDQAPTPEQQQQRRMQ
jgi:hypothetical protein